VGFELAEGAPPATASRRPARDKHTPKPQISADEAEKERGVHHDNVRGHPDECVEANVLAEGASHVYLIYDAASRCRGRRRQRTEHRAPSCEDRGEETQCGRTYALHRQYRRVDSRNAPCRTDEDVRE